MNERISVIIPVYNVESYLDDCICSVVNQTYTNLEIILIDDGSPDRCPQICDAWAKKDVRIRVIHQKNSGLAAARNSGLAMARGEYISFVDSDDLIARTMLESLCSVLKQEHADIVECEYTKFETGTEPRFCGENGREITSFKTEAAIEQLLTEAAFRDVVWNKLYRREIFQTLYFEPGKLHEDVFFTYQAFGLCKKIVKTEAVLYGYRQRSDSTMGVRFSLRRLDAVEAHRQRYLYMRERFPALAPLAQSRALGICMWLEQCALCEAQSGTAAEALAVIGPVYNELYDAQKPEEVPKQRFWFVLGRKNLKLCCRIRNALQVGF